ncbi:hypothetical protein ACWGI8_31770 [Streptomyces sp. NPDC054841]
MTTGRCTRAIRAVMFAAVCALLTALGHAVMSDTAVPLGAVAGGLVLTAAGAWGLARRERGPLLVTSAAVAAQALLHAGFSLAQAAARPVLPGGPSLARQWAQYVTCGTVQAPARAAVDGHGTDGLGIGGHGMDGHEAVHHHMAGPADGMTGMAHDMTGVAHDMTGVAHDITGMTADMAGMAHDIAATGQHMAGMSPLGMLAAHALAALLSGLWLAQGERAATRVRAATRLRGAFRVLGGFAGRLAVSLRLLLLRLPALPHRPRRPRRRRDDGARAPRRQLLVFAITSRGPPVVPAVL